MLHRLLFCLSVFALLMAMNVVAPETDSHQPWFLFDSSPSIKNVGSIADYNELVSIPQHHLDAAIRAKQVRTFPDPNWLDNADLSLALNKLSSEVPPGSTSYIVSDGRALSQIDNNVLPAVNVIGLNIVNKQPIRHIQCPTFFDGNSKIKVDIFLNDSAGDSLAFSVNTRHQLLARPRFDYLSPNHVQLELHPANGSTDFEFEVFVDKDLVQSFQVKQNALPQIKVLRHPIDMAELQLLLESQISCAVEYPAPSSIHKVSAPYNPFKIKQHQKPSIVCLLDISGSMDGAGLLAAKNALAKALAAEQGVELIVYPFNTALQNPVVKFSDIDKLSAFGGTDFGQALTQLSKITTNPKRIFVLSDGDFKTPTTGWRRQLHELFPNVLVRVLPCSDAAQLSTLKQIGQIAQGLTLPDRLQSQIDESLEFGNSNGRLLHRQFFEASSVFDVDSSYPIFAALKSSNVLYADDKNNPLLCIDYFGNARLYSIAGKIGSRQQRQLAAIEQAISKQKKWRSTANGLLINSVSMPAVFQNGSACQVHLVDASNNGNLFLAEVSALSAAELHFPELSQAVLAQPRIGIEFASSPKPYFRWLDKRLQGNQQLNILLLFLALGLFLLGYFVYHRK